MKKLLFASIVTFAGLTAIASGSFADTNEAMKSSKYCETNSADAICMGPEMLAQRAKMMEMSKEKAMESRTKYCQDSASAEDPICDPKMMSDTSGY